MRPVSVQIRPLRASADCCAFAVQRIYPLARHLAAGIGDQRRWFEMLVRPRAQVFSGSPGDYIEHLYSDRPPAHTDVEVIERAMHGLAVFDEPTRLSINVHPVSLTSDSFCDHVLHAQGIFGALGHALCLELVEFGECSDRKLLIRQSERLRSQGVLIAMDDFGTRINCFDLCAAGIVDVVKLDTSVVSGLHLDRYKRAIVESVAKLGSGIGASVIAEGVECAGELRVLEDIGIDFAQGFYLHKPELVGI